MGPKPYDRFRTGLTFGEIRQALKDESITRQRQIDAGLHVRPLFVTRRTVLGRWHELKQSMYSQYVREWLPF